MEVSMNTSRAARLAAVLFVVAAAAFAVGQRETEGAMMTKAPEGAMMARDAGPSWRVEFTSLGDAKALAARFPTVLFFTADWCPTCQAAMQDLAANGAKLGDRRIVLVDYDANRELAKLYHVTYQHTWVWIDAGGAVLATWNGGGVDGIVEHVKPAGAR
jgi:thiol-disulfide isomerase/thioredoxin